MMRPRVAAIVILASVGVAVGSPVVAAPPPQVTNLIVTPDPNLALHLAKYTITFTTSGTGALAVNDKITLKFPTGTTPGAFCGDLASFANNITVNGTTTSASSFLFCLEMKVNVPVAIGNNANVTVVVGSVTRVVGNPGKGNHAMKVWTTRDFGTANSRKYTIVAQATPVAGPVSPQTTAEETAKTIALTASDTDGARLPTDPLTFTIVAGSGPSHGTLGSIAAPICSVGLPKTCSADVVYTPTGDYNGPDSFQFRVRDGIVNSTPATVSITVTPVNDGPTAVDDDATVDQDSGANAINVLANDSDVDGDTLTIMGNTAASDGTAICGPSSCSYDPDTGFSGIDSFTYTIQDPLGAPDTATVRIEVTPAGPGGGGGTASIELCAKTGSVTMPDATTVDIWGYALGDCDVAGAAMLPGPVLEVDVGDVVTITLDNSLGEAVSLELPGQNIAPDATGTPTGTEKTYTFTASNPGTYLYESWMNRQVLMGLYGALIVRPATAGQAYNTAASAFDVEATLVLSEIDPLFNAAPATFDLLTYAPRYWLINGEAYPDTDPILAAADDRVLLRYVNAGSLHHTMTLLGTHERVIGRDADPVHYPYEVDAETVPAGSTLDAIATIPLGVGSGDRFALYNRQMHLDNAGSFPGGMLTFIDVP